jgi:hypothetical protein
MLPIQALRFRDSFEDDHESSIEENFGPAGGS